MQPLVERFAELFAIAVHDLQTRLLEEFGVQNSANSIKFIRADDRSVSNARAKSAAETRVVSA